MFALKVRRGTSADIISEGLERHIRQRGAEESPGGEPRSCRSAGAAGARSLSISGVEKHGVVELPLASRAENFLGNTAGPPVRFFSGLRTWHQRRAAMQLQMSQSMEIDFLKSLDTPGQLREDNVRHDPGYSAA